MVRLFRPLSMFVARRQFIPIEQPPQQQQQQERHEQEQQYTKHDFDDFFHSNHIPLNPLQRGLLSVGSALISITDPSRGDMIACLGETVGSPALQYMLWKMQQSNEGQEILKEQPRINSNTIDLDKLRDMPPNTLGKLYSDFLINNDVTPDSRSPVQFVDDLEQAYVMQRYREVHDLFHTILGMPTNMLGEVTVKWIEGIQLKLPMCVSGAIFGPIRLRPKHRQIYLQYYLPWAVKTGITAEFLMNVYFEKRWDQSIDDLHKELKITPLNIQKN
ncbi:ubiquinone biosynthesis protein COQ4 homolog, mitochondrial [Chrysoperla carnea]|uniref:ubiquinone biosynthesis protein COQ4 homolog, mitochondrial n=1 Tax=Chrysoperla carnea TaxID=189513 RepID=UPI001D064762|nr:ubiquinone biosynthesis protein COQ4 homolog, mitochondrial [Chrysoperla carnea]